MENPEKRKTHKEIDGYTLWSNFTTGPEHRPYMLEEIVEAMQKDLPRVPLEKMLIIRNEVLGYGWSVYLTNEYKTLCDDYKASVKQYLEVIKAALGRKVEWS